jgi:hypothetical protein
MNGQVIPSSNQNGHEFTTNNNAVKAIPTMRRASIGFQMDSHRISLLARPVNPNLLCSITWNRVHASHMLLDIRLTKACARQARSEGRFVRVLVLPLISQSSGGQGGQLRPGREPPSLRADTEVRYARIARTQQPPECDKGTCRDRQRSPQLPEKGRACEKKPLSIQMGPRVPSLLPPQELKYIELRRNRQDQLHL